MNDILKTELLKLSSNSLRILNLGFGSPISYINLLDELKNKENFHFTGVELLDEASVRYMRPCGLNDFDNYFKFYFSTNILDYLKNISSEEKFDAIILSNVLHKIEIVDIPFIMEKCLSLMNVDSIIYVCVLGIKYPGTEDPKNKLFTLDRHTSLKANLNTFWNKEDEQNHLEFIGRKY